MGTVIFRNVPDLVIERLRARAASNGRSGEAEGRAILEEVLVLSPEKTPHAKQIAFRLQQLMLRMNEALHGQPVTVSKLAERMELATVSELENYFAGHEEAPLPLLDRLAERFGANPEWLKHGEGGPFSIHAGGAWSPLDLERIAADLKPQLVCFVRNLGGHGEAAVVLRLQEWQYRVIPTGWHISEHVGAGGARALEELRDLFRKIEYRTARGYDVTSREVPEDIFDLLIRGFLFPAKIVDRMDYRSLWWEDFVDVFHQRPIGERDGYAHYGKHFMDAQTVVRHRLKSRE